MNKSHRIRALAAALLLAVLGTALSSPALAASFQAVVDVSSMKVYAEEAPHEYLGSLPRGTVVTVLEYSGKAARISYNGNTGLAKVADMKVYEEEEPAVSNDTTQEVVSVNRTVAALRDTRIYQKPSTSSRYVTVKAGTTMTLVAYRGDCAQVMKDGKIGYAVYSHLGEPDNSDATQRDDDPDGGDEGSTMDVETNEAATLYEEPDLNSRSITVARYTAMTLLAVNGNCARVKYNGKIYYTYLALLSKPSGTNRASNNPFAEGSNEYIIYNFLIREMGYNHAAACGVMANIKYESGYRPTVNGDSGTSYGICQWHLGRKTNLINYCTDNGWDYNTLEAQLEFLKYEIQTRYPAVHNYLKSVPNTPEGAYDAGYYFCFNFEAPAARTAQSTARGNYAQNTLFSKRA